MPCAHTQVGVPLWFGLAKPPPLRGRRRLSPTRRVTALQRDCVAAPRATAPRNVPIPQACLSQRIPTPAVQPLGTPAGTILGAVLRDPHSCAAARRRCLPAYRVVRRDAMPCAAIEPLTAHYDCLPVRHCPARPCAEWLRSALAENCEESTSSTEACLPVPSAPCPGGLGAQTDH